jgi:hypothetical protein
MKQGDYEKPSVPSRFTKHYLYLDITEPPCANETPLFSCSQNVAFVCSPLQIYHDNKRTCFVLFITVSALYNQQVILRIRISLSAFF